MTYTNKIGSWFANNVMVRFPANNKKGVVGDKVASAVKKRE